MNSKISAINSAILFGQSETVALNTITESDKSRKQEFRFDAIYRNIYFIPLSEDGMRQLRFLTVPNWNEKIWICSLSPRTDPITVGSLNMTLW